MSVKLSSEFTGGMYLNHAAVSPWPKCARDAVKSFAEDNFQDGAKHYPKWLAVEGRLRERLATLVNAGSASDIALLKSTSEALSVVAFGLDFKPGDQVVIPEEEFPSNRIPWEALAQNGDIELIQVKLDGVANPEQALRAACGRKTRLMSVSAVQYISGLRLELSDLGEFCRKNDILLCVDAIQQLGAMDLDVQQQCLDFVVADGHKWMLGPEGLALFYCRPELRERLKLNQYGWHMVKHAGDYSRRDWEPAADARRFECGSPNLMAAHALEASIGLIQDYGTENVSRNILANSAYLMENLGVAGEVITPQRHAGIVSCRFPEAESIWRQLLDEGISCSFRGGALRVSPHFYQEIDLLEEFIKKLRGML